MISSWNSSNIIVTETVSILPWILLKFSVSYPLFITNLRHIMLRLSCFIMI